MQYRRSVVIEHTRIGRYQQRLQLVARMSPGSAVVDRMANINWIGTCTNTIVPNKPNSIHADASLKVEKSAWMPQPKFPSLPFSPSLLFYNGGSILPNWGHPFPTLLSLLLPPFSSSPSPFRYIECPLNTAIGGLGERCKLPQRRLDEPQRKLNLVHFSL